MTGSNQGAGVRVAALDVGSNSFHLVVVEARPDGSIEVLQRAKDMVRLGASSFADGRIDTEAFDRGLSSLQRLAGVARLHGAEAIVAVATSAVREASNGRDFVEAARRLFALDIRIIDGIEEACLIYRGAQQALPASYERVALFDVGGGSTEAVLGNGEIALLSSSLKLGVLRLGQQWLPADPPAPADTALMGEWVRTLMRPTIDRFKAAGLDAVALTSGSALQLARLVGRRLPPVAGIDRYKLTLSAVESLARRLSALPSAERATIPGLDSGRVDTIVPGAVVVQSILELTGASYALVCNAALREGLIFDYLQSRPGDYRPHPLADATRTSSLIGSEGSEPI
jgi:exopolyphosphatase/guanosine-5'-triphosphate,3'-diphosphate pyrophosphatase